MCDIKIAESMDWLTTNLMTIFVSSLVSQIQSQKCERKDSALIGKQHRQGLVCSMNAS